jgi:nicotinate-nucleotide pyrophosphorylase (carboxylating)
MATRDFRQLAWNAELEASARKLAELSVAEDLDRGYDWTSLALVPAGTPGTAAVRSRRTGVVAGLPAAAVLLAEYSAELQLHPLVADGDQIAAGQTLAVLTGPARTLLAAERPLLNLLCHLSGIASLTRRFVEAVQGTPARIYDTRKTLPGWRLLEKYAVRAGGGHNHRLGLYDGVLIKDNHLHLGERLPPDGRYTPASAVRRVKEFLAAAPEGDPRRNMLIEIEVDSLDALPDVLRAGPDLILLDNLGACELQQAVAMRGELAPQVELEASGGMTLDRVAEVAATGVDRISVGALTHSSAWLDLALDDLRLHED